MKKHLILTLLLGFNSLTYAAVKRDWETVYIPDANCGDGIPYKVFVKPGNKSKLAIEFMGGGACWSLRTCWGPTLTTWIHPIPSLPAFSYLTTDESPIEDHTFVYFPYCNGDVYAGDHVAHYLPLKDTYHQGKRNTYLALDYLKKTGKVEFKKAESIVLYGSSAGAIGSLLHRKKIDSFLKPNIKKVLIADSPGLHYGPDFWKKFPDEFITDFKNAFAPVGVKVDVNDGLIAPQFKNYCKKATDWKIGFIQTTRDVIMSKMFGEISQDDHRALVLGPKGILNTLKNSENCSTHISDGVGHMLLIVPDVAKDSFDMKSGESAKDYVDRLITESGI